ncbi:hypothetical protein F2P56_010891 [Juglans regia]|uniref:Uncharacterized protein n=1 Tax=Juglans regia TaxID=51240 RepID=A0A833XKS3_JUGRE|nr:hypothetical protein F2P56_010891 [Juglans regia]
MRVRDMMINITSTAALFALLGGLTEVVTTFFLLRQRRSWDQEVNASSLELRIRRDNQNFTYNALRARFAQDVIWVGLKDLTGRDRMCDLFYVAVQMNDADQV